MVYRDLKGQFIKGSHPITQFMKGQIPHNKGIKISEEVRKKISESLKGKKLSEETKKRIGLALKGKKYKPMSDIGKKNIGNAQRGRKASNETKIKMRKSNVHYWLGKKRPEISKMKKGKIRPEMMGEKNPSWKGGICPENLKIRSGIEFSLWREAVFARDNWTCNKCKVKGGKLHSHHILNFSQFSELRFAIDNGITFCRLCHIKFHKIYGKQNNTKEQLQEFI